MPYREITPQKRYREITPVSVQQPQGAQQYFNQELQAVTSQGRDLKRYAMEPKRIPLNGRVVEVHFDPNTGGYVNSKGGAMPAETVEPVLDKAYQAEKEAERRKNSPTPEEQAFDESSTLDQFGIGAAKSAMDTYYGAKELMGLEGMPMRDQRLLNAVTGVPAALGGMATDTAAAMLPMGVAARGAKALTAGRGAFTQAGAMLGAEGLTNAAIEGIRRPIGDQTRGENALWGAGIGLIPGATGLGVSAAFRRAMAPAARGMLDEGIQLTPGQAVPSLRGAEATLGGLPGFGNVGDLQERAMGQWTTKNIAKKTGVPVTKPGMEGFKQADDVITAQYKKEWAKVNPEDINPWPVEFAYKGVKDKADKIAGKKPKRVLRDALDETSMAFDELETTGSVRPLEELDDTLRELMRSKGARGSKRARNAIQDLREGLVRSLPGDSGARIKALDRRYVDLMDVADSTTRRKATIEKEGVYHPADMLATVKKRSKGKELARGEARGQKELTDAARVFSRVKPGGSFGAIAMRIAALGGILANPFVAIPTLATGRNIFTGAVEKMPGKKVLTRNRRGRREYTAAGTSAVGEIRSISAQEKDRDRFRRIEEMRKVFGDSISADILGDL